MVSRLNAIWQVPAGIAVGLFRQALRLAGLGCATLLLAAASPALGQPVADEPGREVEQAGGASNSYEPVRLTCHHSAGGACQQCRASASHYDIIRIYPLYDLYDPESLENLDTETPGLYKPLLTNFNFSLRSGATFTVGGGFLERHIKPSWRLEGGAGRPILHSDNHRWSVALEFGGSLSVGGGAGVQSYDGVFFTPEEGVEFPLNDMGKFDVSDYRQTAVELALSVYRHPSCRTERWYRRVAFYSRNGVRLGRVHARVRFKPSEALQSLVDDRIGLGMDPDRFQFRGLDENLVVNDAGQVTTEDVNRSDSFVGLFTTIGAGLVKPDVELGSWRLGDLWVGVEAQFSYEWFDLDVDNDDGIMTFSTLFQVTIMR